MLKKRNGKGRKGKGSKGKGSKGQEITTIPVRPTAPAPARRVVRQSRRGRKLRIY